MLVGQFNCRPDEEFIQPAVNTPWAKWKLQ